MYDHHINEMADAVALRLGLDAAGREAVRGAIAGCWWDKIALTWTIDDVRDCKKGIPDDDAMAALAAVLHRHDASLGVTWDTIAMACGGEYPSFDDEDNEEEI
jgi:hypothetical protein